MPQKNSHRKQRIVAELTKDLAKIISQEVKDPSLGLISITNIELTADYAHAKIYCRAYGSVNNDDGVMAVEVLNTRASYLRNLLYKNWSIHTFPQFKFVHDVASTKGVVVDDAIRKAMKITGTEDANLKEDEDLTINQNTSL